jgi:hypothetical protein
VRAEIPDLSPIGHSARATAFGHVRCWGQSGSHLLSASISPFDPEETFGGQITFQPGPDFGPSSVIPCCAIALLVTSKVATDSVWR